MKSAFVNNNPVKLKEVYAPALLATLANEAELGDTVYTKDYVLANKEQFADTEYIFSTWGMPVFTSEEIKEIFKSLKCVFYAAGTVQAFARPFIENGVHVFSAWAANAVPVAEYTVAQIILANKGFFAHSREMKKRNLSAGRDMKAAYLGNFDLKVGLIGAGMIGSLVAEMLKAYKLEVLVFDPFLAPERAEKLGVKLSSLDEIFSSCNVVSNHLANNAQTQGILNGSHFSKMLPYSTFINTGRGAQVVEADLIKTLEERPDVTAILDVTYPEPPVEGSPFYTLPNCFLTPHIAGSLCNETHRMSEYMYAEYCAFVKGEPTRYEVSMKMLETMA